ncbi:unnamed protein product [Tilletia controversa]|nr:unnamed protein product [Tilletia controversa]
MSGTNNKPSGVLRPSLIVNVPNNTGSINLRWPKLPDTAEPDAKSSYEHLFNLAAKYEQARLTISGQSTKIAAMVKDNETLKTELTKAQTTIADQGASITRLSDALTHIKDGAVAAAENMLANIKILKKI